VPENRIYQIVRGQRNITADTALRLGKFFNTGAALWLNLQKAYELDVAREKIGDSLDHIVPYRLPESSPSEASPVKNLGDEIENLKTF
jgi:plasmid maintenance system antidote protein VapI